MHLSVSAKLTKMNWSRGLALIVLAVAVWLAVEAWSIVAPAVEQGWLGLAGRVFLPLILLVGLSVWLWQRR